MERNEIPHTISKLQQNLLELFQEEYQMVGLGSLTGLEKLQEPKRLLFQDYANLLQELAQHPEALHDLGEEKKHLWAEAATLFVEQVEKNQEILQAFFQTKASQFETLRELIQVKTQKSTYHPLDDEAPAPSSSLFSSIQRSV